LHAINLGNADTRTHGETIEALCRTASAQGRLLGLSGTRLRLDASRAMVEACCCVLVQVLLRKDDAIYVNDGRFGWLHALDRQLRRNSATLQLRRRSGTPSKESRSFRLFGPTCDSYDAFEAPAMLPADVREGDWLEIPAMGADTIPWACSFNGLHPSLFAVVAAATANDRSWDAPPDDAICVPLPQEVQL
jgi:ornithine decarboxylase